jgi:hypothetical protein
MNEPVTLQAAREQAIDLLCRRFADDTLSMPELERRLDKARSARTREELRSLLADLPGPPTSPARTTGAPLSPAPGTGPEARLARPAARAPGRHRAGGERGVRTSSSVALAVLGGTRRAGKWAPPENMLALAVMGGVELDFREALLAPGSVTTITCFAFWGGIEITVPPDVQVDTAGFALLGGFEQADEALEEPPEDAPVIRVNGLALMGGVEVSCRRPGAKRMSDARRRGRLERGGSTDIGDVGDVGGRDDR